MYRRFVHRLLPLLALLCLACGGSGLENDPVFQLSAAEALEEGKRLMAEGKYRQAQKYLTHAFEVEPNSLSGREGLLMAADALYYQNSGPALIEAESRYRDFLNRFPTSQQSAYAQFQIARCLTERMAKPDRDQSAARNALAEFQDVLRLYPTSEYAAQARDEMKRVTQMLAEHEFVVGKFYMRFGIPISAVSRFRDLLDDYPDYPERDKVLFYLCRAYERSEQPENAADTCNQLRQEFPDSRFAARARAAESDNANVDNSGTDLAADGNPDGNSDGM